jgi:transcriptional regulator with XRE-family HTH domain
VVVKPEASFAAWVRELRQRLRLSQDGLARQVGVSQTTIGRWEQGATHPPRATRGRLAELAEGAGLGPPPGREDDEG